MSLPRSLLAFVAAVIALLALASPAAAELVSQEDDSSGTEVKGTLRTTSDEGEDVFVEDVTFVVTDEAGTEVGIGVTDSEGNWSVDLPGAGTYSVLLDDSTLPEGVPLRNPDNNPLTVEIGEGDSRPTLFPLGEATSGAATTIEAVQLFVDGLKLGLIIAMSAIGLSLIYGTTGLTNFAHGEMVTFGAIAAFIVHMVYPGRILGIPGTNSLIFAGAMTVLLGGAFGWALNEFVWRRLRN